MATTAYRFVGSEPEVFPDFSSAFVIAGRQDDPNAPDFQQAGELRPDQEFEGPAGVVHVRIERKARNGKWVATVKPPKKAASTDTPPDDDDQDDDTPPTDTPPTDPPPEA